MRGRRWAAAHDAWEAGGRKEQLETALMQDAPCAQLEADGGAEAERWARWEQEQAARQQTDELLPEAAYTPPEGVVEAEVARALESGLLPGELDVELVRRALREDEPEQEDANRRGAAADDTPTGAPTAPEGAVRTLPEAELAVMQALWDCARPAQRQQIERVLCQNHPMATTTVLTLLSRLGQKGFVQTERQGRSAVYFPLVEREDYLARQSEKFYQQVCGGSVSAFAAALCQSGLSRQELDELRRLLEKNAL